MLREIDLLGEYRTRLVADVVTGKLDVCEAAASQPNESEEQLAAMGLLPDGEESEDEQDLEGGAVGVEA